MAVAYPLTRHNTTTQSTCIRSRRYKIKEYTTNHHTVGIVVHYSQAYGARFSWSSPSADNREDRVDGAALLSA